MGAALEIHRVPRLAAVMLAVAALVVTIAWTTELRAVLHGGLLALCVFAFLPFVVIATLIALILVLSLVLGLLGGAAHAADLAGFGEGLLHGKRGIESYYGFLLRHRGSAWLGVPAGLLLGILMVWGLLGWLVVPHELRTTETLLGLKTQIDSYYTEQADYPTPSQEGRFVGPDGNEVRDDFGRPLHYEVQGKWRMKSYRLASHGVDGVPSDDDLCVEGRTKLQSVLETSTALLNLADAARRFKSGAPLNERLKVLNSARCERQPLQPANADN